MSIIDIKKLAAVDMAWFGSRIIISEYILGVLLPLGLGILSLYKGQIVIGIWLITIAANYVPLFLYAITLKRAGRVEAEGKPEIAHAKKYGIQQIIILIPLAVVLLAITQELKKKSQPHK
ncbi:MAG TPA: hypothetical protein VN711_01855 [Candidatus Saccharimonadales bacterium]|nr:hypothetical protein [Candidatus Saccharimonadales bacterium]